MQSTNIIMAQACLLTLAAALCCGCALPVRSLGGDPAHIVKHIQGIKRVGKEDVGELSNWLAHKDAQVRLAAVSALMDAWQERVDGAYPALKAGRSRTADVLVQYLQQPKIPKQKKYRAFSMLGYLGVDAARAVPFLDRMLDDKSRQFDYMVLRALARIGPAAVPTLRGFATGKRKTAIDKQTIYNVLTTMRPVPAAFGPMLEDAALRSCRLVNGHHVTQSVLNWMLRRGEAALPGYYRFLAEGNIRLRTETLSSLQILGQKKAVRLDAVFALLAIEDRDMLRSTTWALQAFSGYRKGAYHDDLALGWRKVLREGPKRHHALALAELAKLPSSSPAELDVLLATLGNGAESVSIAAAKALAKKASSVSALASAYDSATAARRKWIVLALGYCGKKAMHHLARALDDPEERVRWRAIIALKRLGASAIPVLKSALTSKKPRQLRAALTAVAKMRAVALKPEVSLLRKHGDPAVARLASTVHMKLGN